MMCPACREYIAQGLRARAKAHAETVSHEYDIGPVEILSDSRRDAAVRARRAVWSRLRAEGMTLQDIGRATGHHHSTVMHGLRQYEGA